MRPLDVGKGNRRLSSRFRNAHASAREGCACLAGSASNRKARGPLHPRIEYCEHAGKNHPPPWKQQFLRARHNDRQNILLWNAGLDPHQDRMGAAALAPRYYHRRRSHLLRGQSSRRPRDRQFLTADLMEFPSRRALSSDATPFPRREDRSCRQSWCRVPSARKFLAVIAMFRSTHPRARRHDRPAPMSERWTCLLPSRKRKLPPLRHLPAR